MLYVSPVFVFHFLSSLLDHFREVSDDVLQHPCVLHLYVVTELVVDDGRDVGVEVRHNKYPVVFRFDVELAHIRHHKQFAFL